MKTQVAVGETDDPGFIAVLNSLVQGLISNRAPEQLWIIQIDNWFDHKWLRFSGMERRIPLASSGIEVVFPPRNRKSAPSS